MVPAHVRSMFLDFAYVHVQGTYNALKELSDIMKKYQHSLCEHWLNMTDVATIEDYLPAYTNEEIDPLVQEWVTGDIEHEFKDGGFDELFEQGCDAFLSVANGNAPDFLTPEEFLSDPMYWATPGTSYERRHEFKINGKKYKTRKSKWATAYSITSKELVSIFYSDKPQYNKVSTKREPGKKRLIIAGDLANYLRMSYISKWLDHELHGHPNTTLFYTPSQYLGMWTQMESQLYEDGVNVPIDETKYDHYITKRMVLSMFNSVRRKIQRSEIPIKDDLLNVLELTQKSILHEDAAVVTPNKLFKYQKGLLSGWRWTAFFNTLANCAKVYAFRVKMAQRLDVCTYTAVDPVINFTSQGDDVRARLKSKEHAKVFSDLYLETGFNINPKKNFISSDSDEYLRQVATYKRVGGYPIRGVNSLIFRNPASREAQAGELRIRELAANWLLVIRRTGASLTKVSHHMYRDLAKSSGYSIKEMKIFAHAYAANGGLGLSPANNYTVKFTAGKITTEHYTEQQPPILTEVFGNYPQYHGYISSIWRAGIDYGPKLKLHKEPDILQFTESQIYKYELDGYDPPIPAGKIAGPRDVLKSPSLGLAAIHHLAMAKSSDLINQAQYVLDQVSLSTLSVLKSRGSMTVARQWLTNRLPFSTPQHSVFGPTIVAPLYEHYSAIGWADCLSHGKITVNRLRSVATWAELSVQRYLQHYPVIMTG